MRRRPEFRPRARSYSDRAVDNRPLVERFLIVCEGEETEPNYFRAFRVPGKVVEVRGLGFNTISLVRKAIDLAQAEDYDQAWCVFDRDSFPASDFRTAISLAREHGIRVAYSNECFELWYLLHFCYCDTALDRKQCAEKLGKHLPQSYEKNSECMHEFLAGRQQAAIRHARRLLGQYTPCCPESDNPSTTVHLLVEELIRVEQRS